MIDKAMELLRDEAQEHIRIRERLASSDSVVELGSFVDATGRVSLPADRIGLTLFNIEEERAMKAPGNVARGAVERAQPEVRLNLHILFAANFENYSQGLKLLSRVIGHFQNKPVIDRHNTPKLDPKIAQLAVESYAMTLEQQSHLWSIIGGKYLPSVAFRARLAFFQDEEAEPAAVPVLNFRLQKQRIPPGR